VSAWGERTTRTRAFAQAARCYWFEVYPRTQRELGYWKRRAEAIPDPALRRDALFTHRTKSRHAEGLAAFAVLAPPERRRDVAKCAVAYESMLDYLDTVSEHPVEDHVASSLWLHRAFEAAVDTELPISDDYYALRPHRDDGGYLTSLITTCREVLKSLPSYSVTLEALRRCAAFSGQAQSFTHAIPFGLDRQTIVTWAAETTTTIALDREIEWWEVVAAGSSSLPIGVLMAAAADPATSPEDVSLIEAAYFPWIASMTSLLDCLIDVESDEAAANHLNRYSSREDAAEHLAAIVSRSLQLASGLPKAELHKLILAGAGGFYLAQPNAWAPGWDLIARRVLEELGEFGRPAVAVHCVRQGRPRAALRMACGGATAA
jgi:tetraprenyl-beta-curcumene synthase